MTPGESVEQAAPDWQARANREAAAILAETGFTFGTERPVCIVNRDELLSLLAIAWMQGTILGSHETLGHAERAFDRMRDAL